MERGKGIHTLIRANAVFPNAVWIMNKLKNRLPFGIKSIERNEANARRTRKRKKLSDAYILRRRS